MKGYIKLYRSVIDNPVFDNPQLLKMWLWILCNASHKACEIMVGLEVVKLEPGQLITGRTKLKNELGYRNESTARSHLKKLESLRMIELKSNNKMTIVTVANWSKYQDCENENANEMTANQQQNDNKITTKCQQNDTNKNVKNVKNDKNIKKENKQKKESSLFAVFWDAYPKKKAKEDAQKAFYKLDVDESMLAGMISAIERQKRSEQWRKDSGQFIPYPATWLNGKRWEDSEAVPLPDEKKTPGYDIEKIKAKFNNFGDLE